MKRTVAVFVALVCAFLAPVPAYAIDLPDNTPTIVQFNVYRNVLETGDRLLFIYSNIPYATTPDEPVWQTYMWTLVSSDNTTELGTVLPYSYNDNGYGYNLASMYFSTADSANFTWSGAHIVRLRGNPSAFGGDAPIYDYPLDTTDYSTLTDSSAVESEIVVRVLEIAADLDVRWGLSSAYSLLNETETGTVLSIYGEAFFRAVMNGLQGIAPGVFAYVIDDLDLTARTWGNAYETLLLEQWDGTWVGEAKDAADALFGTSYSLFWIIIALACCVTVVILNVIGANDAWLGIMDASACAIVTAKLGLYGLGFLGLLAAVAVIYTASRMWGVLK